MAQNLLFSPIRIGGMELPGRLVKSATTEARCTADGFVTGELIEYYEQIARGGTPLLITGNAYFNLYSNAGPRQLGAGRRSRDSWGVKTLWRHPRCSSPLSACVPAK